MKRVRGKQHLKIYRDEVTGRMYVLQNDIETDVLSDEGSLDSQVTEEVIFSDCGCQAPAVGRCQLCSAFSCINCHGRCQTCKIPVCLQCSVFVNEPSAHQIRLCKSCYDNTRRKQRLAHIGKIFLSPFIKFEDRHEKT